MTAHASLIAELEAAIQDGSNDERTAARVVDLLLANADRLNEQQIGAFDDVLGRLVGRLDSKARAALAGRLTPIENAPAGTVRRLALDEDIDVAEPILAQSARLTTGDLVAIAKIKSQAHLLAIAGRAQLGEFVTDALLQNGDGAVVHTVAGNTGACVSESGFSILLQRAEKNESLAETVGLRPDIPLQLFRKLLLRATEAVRSRLLAAALPERQAEIRRMLSLIANDAARGAKSNGGARRTSEPKPH
jgi:uncharacterized protein (DUF2336 family)